MRRGAGKAKGAAYEREVCKALSLWVTNGKRIDCFWRSAMSGGRATIAHGRDVRQCGDITAVAQEGYPFARRWYVECKHVKHLALDSYIIKGVGLLRKFWMKALIESRRYDKDPMLIARQNGWPDIVITKHNHLGHWVQPLLSIHYRAKLSVDISFLSELLKVSYDGLNHRPKVIRKKISDKRRRKKSYKTI